MTSPDAVMFRRGATRLIALHGGWNDRSRRAVLWLAARHSIPASEIASVLTSQGAAGAISGASGEAVSTVRSAALRGPMAPQDRNTHVLAVMFVISLVSLVLSVGIALIVLPSALRKSHPTPVDAARSTPSEAVQETPVREVPVNPEHAPEQVRPDVLGGIGLEQPIAKVLAELEPTFNNVAAQWDQASRAERREQRAALAAALMRLFSDGQTPGEAFEVLEHLFAPVISEPLEDEHGISGEQIRTAMLAADVLESLDARRLSAWIGQRLRTLMGAMGSDLSDPVLDTARACAEAIRTPQDAPGQADRIERVGRAWQAWTDTILALAGANSVRRSELLLAGLDVLTRHSPDASESIAVTSALRTLAAALGWNPQAPERVWLTRAMLDSDVSAEELYIITGAMVTSSAPGIDATMVVARNASENARREALGRFMAVWGMTSSVEMVGFTSRWSQVAKDVLSSSRSGASINPREALERAVLMATLNAAAAQASSGNYERADELLTVARSASERSTPADEQALSEFTLETDETSGRWAMEFLEYETDSATRLGLLRRVPNHPDEVDAEVLVHAAMRDPASRVRRAAASKVRTLSDEPTIVNALLEASPLMPRTGANSSLIADVTLTPQVATSDPRWRFKLRLALVERLHELIGQRSQGPWIDTGAKELAQMFAQQAGVTGTAGSTDPLVELAALHEVWRTLVEDESSETIRQGGLEGVRSRLSRRLAIARSDPQRVVAHRRAITEMMAMVIEAQRPDRVERVAEMVHQTDEQLDEVDHVFGQIEALERLGVELWLVKLEENL